MDTLNVEVEFSEEDSGRIDAVVAGRRYDLFVMNLALIGLAAVEAGQAVIGVAS